MAQCSSLFRGGIFVGQRVWHQVSLMYLYLILPFSLTRGMINAVYLKNQEPVGLC